MHPHTPERRAEPSVLLRSANMMLDELAEHRRREHALDRQLRGTRLRIAALLVPLTAVLGALDRRGGAGRRARLAGIDAEYGPEPRRLGGTPASEALLDFLAARESESVTVAEAQAQLARAGLAPKPRYAALALNRLQEQAVVSRQRFATYAINRYHPELVARRLAAAQALEQAAGESPAGEDAPTP